MADPNEINLVDKYNKRSEMKILDRLGLSETPGGQIIPAPYKAMTKPVINKTAQGVDAQLGLVGSNKPLDQGGAPTNASQSGVLFTQEFPEAALGLQNVKEMIRTRTGATEQTHDLKSFVASGEGFVFDKERGHLTVPEKFKLSPREITLQKPGGLMEAASELSSESERKKSALRAVKDTGGQGQPTIEEFIADVDVLRQEEEATRQKLLALKSGFDVDIVPPATAPTGSEELGGAILDVVTGIPRKVASNIAEFVVRAGDEFRNIELDTNTPNGGTIKMQEVLDSFGLGGKIKVPKPTELRFGKGQEGRKLIVDMGAFIAMMAILKQAGAGTLPASFGSEFLTVDANQNLSNMFNQLAPELRNPITDFLEAKIDDSELEKRLKMLTESGALGITIDMALALARQMKLGGFRALKNEDGSIQFGPGRKITETKEFKEFFGNSKVVSDDGEPLVVYHGTASAGFDQFDTFGANYGLFGKGSYFTESTAVAGEYSKKGAKRVLREKGEVNSAVVPVYLSIRNPIDMDAAPDIDAWAKHFDRYITKDEISFAKTNEEVFREIEEVLSFEQIPQSEGEEIIQDGIMAMGHDGITHMGGGRIKQDSLHHRVWIAFEPEQIRSTFSFKTFLSTLRNEEGAIQFGPGGFDDSIKGKKVFPDEPFVDSTGATKTPKKQMFSLQGRQKDLGRFSINWDFVNKPDDVKQVMMAFRKQFKKELLRMLPEKRTLDAVAQESLDRLNKSTGDEFVKFLTRNAKEGFTDVDLAVAKWFRNESANELLFIKDQFLNGAPGYRKRFAEHLTMHSEVERIHQTMQAFSSNLLNANKVVLDMEMGQGKNLFAAKVGDLVGGISPTDDLLDIAMKMDTFETPGQLEVMAKNMGRPGFNDMLEEAYVAGLLSSPKTHMVNIVSNTLTLLNHFGPERAFRAGVGTLTRSRGRVRFGELSESLFGFSEAVRESWRIAKNTFKTGTPDSPGVKIEGRLDQAITADNVDALLKRVHAGKHPMRFFVSDGIEKSGVVGRAFDGMGMVYSVPFRGLMAMDDFFKTMAYRMEVNALAYRKAVNAGKTGKELAEEIVRLKTEIPKDIQIDASAAARYVTFTEALGPKGQSIQDAIKSWGLPARYVIPFIRTPTNIFKYNMERTPGLNLFIKESREALLKPGTEAFDTAMARITMGGLIAYSVMELSDRGMITGSAGDFEASKDRMLMATDYRAGWRKNSLLVAPPELLKERGFDFDEFYISYDRGGDAFGMLMGLAADMRKLTLTAPDDVTEKAFAVFAMSMRNQLLNRTWMANFRELMENINFLDESSDLRKLARTLVPRLVANLRTEVDPAMREARTIIDQLKKEVPFFSEDLSLRLNAWGDWIPADPSLGWDFFSPFTVSKKSKDKVDLEMQRQRFGLPEIQKIFELDGARIELTPKQMNRWKIITGKELKQDGRNLKETVAHMLEDEVYKEATDGPGGGKEAMVHAVYRAFRDAAKMQLLQEDDVLRAKWKSEVKKRVERLTGATVDVQ